MTTIDLPQIANVFDKVYPKNDESTHQKRWVERNDVIHPFPSQSAHILDELVEMRSCTQSSRISARLKNKMAGFSTRSISSFNHLRYNMENIQLQRQSDDGNHNITTPQYRPVMKIKLGDQIDEVRMMHFDIISCRDTNPDFSTTTDLQNIDNQAEGGTLRTTRGRALTLAPKMT